MKFLLAGVCILGLLPLHKGQAQEVETINVPLSLVSWARPVTGLLYLQSGGEFEPVRVHNMRRSAVIEYQGQNPLVIYRKNEKRNTTEVLENEDALYQPVGSVYLDPKLKQALLFVVQEGNQLQITSMEDSFESYPLGSYRFHNYTSQPLLAKFGDSILKLKSRKTAYLEEPFSTNSEFPVVFVLEQEGEIRPLYTNRWQHTDQMRYLILISSSGTRDTSPIEFQILSDYPTHQRNKQVQ